MCGNPRKYLGEATVQEKKFREAWPILALDNSSTERGEKKID